MSAKNTNLNSLPSLVVESTLPLITANFEVIETQLRSELKKYDLLVDEDSVKTAKNMATQINVISQQIDTLRKERIKELKVPIDKFDTKCKSLIAICQKSRGRLLSQVEVFDNKKKQECLILLKKELSSNYLKFEIKDEFKTVNVEDLAILSNLNKTGIAKKAMDEIEKRVIEVKKLQDLVNTRLLELEGRCYKAGLTAPLTRLNVDHFLKTKDEVYESSLNLLLDSEIKRLKTLNKPKETTPTPKEQPPQPKQTIQPRKTSGNIQKYKVVFEIEIEVDEAYEAQIEPSLVQKLQRGGLKATPKVAITRLENQTSLNNAIYKEEYLAEGSLF